MSTPFSFLVHFRNQLQADFSCLHPALGKLPEGLYRSIVRTLSLPSVEWGKVQSDGASIGEIRIVPTTPEMMLHSAPEKSAERITRAIQTARDQGFNLVGLGALTAPVMQGGLALRRRMDVGITNGNAFTPIDEKAIPTDISEQFAVNSIMIEDKDTCLLYTSPSPRDLSTSRMPSSA